ncbi:hypothetical protein V7S43_015594 [Phytophthora oleae]|uniref:Uncharacterized protein n=1 Tax=Phytophthora oleae TaxID=2107226 RepID=A0ABD3EXQ2_9STRA
MASRNCKSVEESVAHRNQLAEQRRQRDAEWHRRRRDGAGRVNSHMDDTQPDDDATELITARVDYAERADDAQTTDGGAAQQVDDAQGEDDAIADVD